MSNRDLGGGEFYSTKPSNPVEGYLYMDISTGIVSVYTGNDIWLELVQDCCTPDGLTTAERFLINLLVELKLKTSPNEEEKYVRDIATRYVEQYMNKTNFPVENRIIFERYLNIDEIANKFFSKKGV